MADEVKEKTHGDLVINVHLGGSLPIKADGVTAAACSDGVIQFGDDGFATGTIPVTGVSAPALADPERDRDEKGDGDRAAISRCSL